MFINSLVLSCLTLTVTSILDSYIPYTFKNGIFIKPNIKNITTRIFTFHLVFSIILTSYIHNTFFAILENLYLQQNNNLHNLLKLL